MRGPTVHMDSDVSLQCDLWTDMEAETHSKLVDCSFQLAEKPVDTLGTCPSAR